MAYVISETGEELLQDVQRFCELEVYGKEKNWDKEGKMPDETRQLLCSMGYQTLTIPDELGGLGISSVDVAAILEEIAKADAGLAVTLAGSNLALRAVLAGGSHEQKEKVCTILAECGLGAFCLTEAGAGSDVSALSTQAVKLEDGSWKLTGTKQFITNGSVADFYVVAAKADGSNFPSLFLIDAGVEGLTAGEQEDKLGIRSCDTCTVDFNNCILPADALIGGPEAEVDRKHGMKAILASLNEGRVFMAAIACGVAQRAMEETIKYGKERNQFGRPITENQAVQFKLADMQIKIEAARQLTSYALTLKDEGRDFAGEAAMAKAFAADTAAEVTGQAMELFGGYGYMTHFPIEKLLRDARVFPVIEGTGEMQRMLIAGQLLRERRG
jgi:butyryl-CoA dehydrogenase